MLRSICSISHSNCSMSRYRTMMTKMKSLPHRFARSFVYILYKNWQRVLNPFLV